jgi:hypothetical protein
MGFRGSAEVAQLALAGGGGVEAKGHGESVICGGLLSFVGILRVPVSEHLATFDNRTLGGLMFSRLEHISFGTFLLVSVAHCATAFQSVRASRTMVGVVSKGCVQA